MVSLINLDSKTINISLFETKNLKDREEKTINGKIYLAK